MGMDIKIFRMNRLGIPQDRIAKRAGVNQASIHNHLLKMATLPNLINADLSMGFTAGPVAEKHNWRDVGDVANLCKMVLVHVRYVV